MRFGFQESFHTLVAFPSLISFRFASIASILILATVAGATVSTAAQAALPGEVLYPLKQAGETVAGNFYLSHEARASWEEEKLQRRLEEAEMLMSMKRLGPKERKEIVGTLQKHIDAVQENIESLETQGNTAKAVELDASLDKSLATHREVLKSLVSEIDDKEQKQEALQVIHQVEEVLTPVGTVKGYTSSAVASDASSESSSVSSLSSANAAEQHLQQRGAARKMSEASTILMLLRLNQDIDTAIVDELSEKYTQAGALFQAGSYLEALTLYEEILQRGNDLLQPVSSSSSSILSEPGASTLPLTGSLTLLDVTSSSSSL